MTQSLSEHRLNALYWPLADLRLFGDYGMGMGAMPGGMGMMGGGAGMGGYGMGMGGGMPWGY